MKNGMTTFQFARIILSMLFAGVAGACLYTVVAAQPGWTSAVPIASLAASLLVVSFCTMPWSSR